MRIFVDSFIILSLKYKYDKVNKYLKFYAFWVSAKHVKNFDKGARHKIFVLSILRGWTMKKLYAYSILFFAALALNAQQNKPEILNPVGEAFDVRQEYAAPVIVKGDSKGALTDDLLPKNFKWHVVLLNQIGFETNAPKRFTAPISKDGSVFIVCKLDDTKPLFKGTVKNNIGDFSAFKPQDEDAQYVVMVGGGDLKTGASDPFYVKTDAYKKIFHQRAVDFLIDVRSVVGTHPSAYGGGPWRDGWVDTDFVLPSLILFYLANKEEVLSMPRQIDYAAEKSRVLAADFPYIPENKAGPEVLARVRTYFNEVPPPAPDAPDVIKMIHWGAAYRILQIRENNKEAWQSTQSLEQLTYFLWAQPALEKWIPKPIFEEVRLALFGSWDKSRIMTVPWYWDAKHYTPIAEINSKKKDPVGGGRTPGHSIVPNILMYEVAKRNARPDAQIYLDAAVKQADWVVKNVDWNNPLTTKGNRYDEHRTITNLVWLLKSHPEVAPAGLKEKIDEWVNIVISRSDNMWDFRMLSPELGLWSVPYMNDVGNLLCFPAIATAASWVEKDTAKKARLKEIMYAQIDAVWGRNPRLSAGVSHPQVGWDGLVERGWPVAYGDNICARLELCRSSIATSCGTEAYPFNPNGKYRHAEGWVMYGSVWMLSLAYLEFDAEGKRPWDAIPGTK